MNRKISSDARTVMKTLSKQEISAIQIDFPLKRERNKIVKNLRNQGVEIAIIQEISRIPRSTISRIARTYFDEFEFADKFDAIIALLEKIVQKIDRS